MPASSTQPAGSASLHAAISDAAMRVLADYTGRGATSAKTTLAGDWCFIILTDTLTKGEQRLAETGNSEFVLEARKRYQHAMREDLTGAVERLTGRKVVAFMSDNHINPDVGVEAMMLEVDGGTPKAG